MEETSGLWTRCTASLREQVSETTWQMWLSSIEPVSFGDGTIVLGVPNLVVRDRVDSRFLPLIEETLAVMAGHPIRTRLQVVDRGAADLLEPDDVEVGAPFALRTWRTTFHVSFEPVRDNPRSAVPEKP